LQFAYSLLTRSLRVSHENLRTRDTKLVAAVEDWFAARAAAQSGRAVVTAPPMSMPFRLREVVLDNRLVADSPAAPANMASCVDGARPAATARRRLGLRLAGDFATGHGRPWNPHRRSRAGRRDDPRATLSAFDAARGVWQWRGRSPSGSPPARTPMRSWSWRASSRRVAATC